MAVTIETTAPEQTFDYGQKLAECLKPGDIIGLTGDLGAGKTLFVKGIAAGLQTEEDVTSPTFSLLNIYTGKYKDTGKSLPVYHYDLYRLEHRGQLEDIGFEESLSVEVTGALIIIEWPDNFFECLPDEYLLINLKSNDAENPFFRLITLSPKGKRYEELCGELTS